jgi:hypothetical protein
MSESKGARLAEVANKVLGYLYDQGAVCGHNEERLDLLHESIDGDSGEVGLACQILQGEELVNVEHGDPHSLVCLTVRGFGAVAKTRQDGFFYNFV